MYSCTRLLFAEFGICSTIASTPYHTVSIVKAENFRSFQEVHTPTQLVLALLSMFHPSRTPFAGLTQKATLEPSVLYPFYILSTHVCRVLQNLQTKAEKFRLFQEVHTPAWHLRRRTLHPTSPLYTYADIPYVPLNLPRMLLCKLQTKAEKFRFFQEVHTPAWHLRRHRQAQAFMDRFVRQNIAEIDEIRAEEKVVSVTLPPAERAIYLELDHHLQVQTSSWVVYFQWDGVFQVVLQQLLLCVCASAAVVVRCASAAIVYLYSKCVLVRRYVDFYSSCLLPLSCLLLQRLCTS